MIIHNHSYSCTVLYINVRRQFNQKILNDDDHYCSFKNFTTELNWATVCETVLNCAQLG